VKAHGFDKRYELQVSLCQLSVMTLFNEKESIEMRQILQMSRLTMADFKRHFNVLIDLNLFKIKGSSPSSVTIDNISESDFIVLESSFTNKRTKIKVPQITASETPKERDTTHKAIDDDRKLYLQVRFTHSNTESMHLTLPMDI
jgi:hypothetical protein